MRRWRSSPSEQELSSLNGESLERSQVLEDLLRRNVEDIFRVERQEIRGSTFGWGGTLLVDPARALALISPRFKTFGFTAFLGRQGDLVWIRAVPLAEVGDRGRSRVNLLLFVLTVLSTLAAGCLVNGSFPFVTFNPFLRPLRLLDGVPFAFTLLAILGTHEFGHYFTARAYGASVSLPYFIPAPPPIFLFGTMGAVIRMRSPARDRNSLFDIAVAGPLAGLAVAVPALLLGLSWSRVGMVLPEHSGLIFGDSLLMRALTWLVFGSIPPGMDVFVHPVALAGWVGLFVTALNLFPVGQLDGGRIAYALFGSWHRQVSIATFVGLMALGAVFRSANWIVFAGLILLLMGFHHPPPLDDLTPLSRRRYVLGVFCLILLILLIPPVPIS
ncbi:MAG TPA: site-2 protease family protein [Methylomirabilota bacterium]|nr:site-2 protease family protein [Methylomirabilota bacterium]